MRFDKHFFTPINEKYSKKKIIKIIIGAKFKKKLWLDRPVGTVDFCWVPAHGEIELNVEDDRLAKEATEEEGVSAELKDLKTLAIQPSKSNQSKASQRVMV